MVVVARFRPSGPFQASIICLAVIDIAGQNGSPGGAPGFIGDDPLGRAIRVVDLKLGEQRQPIAVDVALPTVEAESPSIPTIAQDGANGVAPFIDGRTELYGEKFFVDHNAASGLMEPDNLFRLLAQYNIEATLLRTQSAATKLLDRVDGWQKIYSDDIATIHLRKAGAAHSVEPAVDPKAK